MPPIRDFAVAHAARIFGILNICGDAFIFASGASYDSIFRQMAAVSGIAASALITFYGEGLREGRPGSIFAYFARWKNPAAHPIDVGMGLIFFSGVCYMLSGIFQFPVEGRPQESLMGLFLFLATVMMILRKPGAGSLFFLCTTGTSLTMPFLFHEIFDRMAAGGAVGPADLIGMMHLDGYIIGAVTCFMTANIMARFIGQKNKQNQPVMP